MRFPTNPVVVRELGARTRSRTAVMVMVVFLALVTGVALIAYEAERATSTGPFDPVTATESAQVGRSIFDWTLLVVLLLVHFVVPALAAGAIAGERERRTLAPLQLTLLRPRSIVLGKLLASIAFVGLLAAAAAPVLAVGYLVGGVDVSDLVRAAAAVVGTTIVLGSIGIACSALAHRVQAATVAAYAIVAVLTLGSLAAHSAVAILDDRRGDDPVDPPAALLVGAPILAVADLMVDDTTADRGPLAALASLTEGDDGDPGNFWPVSSVVLSIVSVTSLAFATRRVTTPSRGEP